jgi:hypothetical protein
MRVAASMQRKRCGLAPRDSAFGVGRKRATLAQIAATVSDFFGFAMRIGNF